MSGRVEKFLFAGSLSDAAPDRAESRQQPGSGMLRTVRLAVLLPSLVVAIMLVCAIAPSWVAPFGPADMDSDAILHSPGRAHLLGTDQFGRDVLSLLVYGARQSLFLAFGAIALGGGVGTIIGLVSGYAGGKIDFCIMRLVDVWMSVPQMLLALIIAAALRGGAGSTVIAVAMMIVAPYVRVMRSQVIAVKGRPFVQASRAIGASSQWTLWRHVVPHTLSPMLVLATLGVGDVILVGAALSFIGLGVIDDRPDWGYLLSQGRNYITMAWWYATFPGLSITALVISANLLGDSLRHRLDPRRSRM